LCPFLSPFASEPLIFTQCTGKFRAAPPPIPQGTACPN
jgi:hypothetical protein